MTGHVTEEGRLAAGRDVFVFGSATTTDWSIVGDRKELDVRDAHLGPYCYRIQ
jgi:hypothetical protein